MYANAFQKRQLTIFYSVGSRPLKNWKIVVNSGTLKRITDNVIKSLVLEFCATNIANNYISCPVDPHEILAIRMPFFVMLFKNSNKSFSFELEIGDDMGFLRRFRVSTFNSATVAQTFAASLPLNISPGWNTIMFDMRRLMQSLYGAKFYQVTRIKIHANCSLRRIYFSDRIYQDSELKDEYKLIVRNK